MLTVYDPLCDGLRDPCGITGEPVLSWRLGCDCPGARQASCHVVVTSLTNGECAWDSGEVCTANSFVTYAGRGLCVGETCTWFVTVTDDDGQVAYGVPSSFVVGRAGDVAQSPYGPQRLGCAWTSSERLDWQLEQTGDDVQLDGTFWRDLLGVHVEGALVEVRPHVPSELSFAQGCLLLGRGLLVVRVENDGDATRLGVSLPPGMVGVLALGDERREVVSGRHSITSSMAERR